MKAGIGGLAALRAEIERRAKGKQDLVAATTNMRVAAYASGEEGAPAVDLTVGQGDNTKRFTINSVAHRQIQSHLKIPADYYDRMLASQPELLAENINTWLWANRENRLVRTLFGTTRAFLSDRYRPLENEDLAEAVLPPLEALDLTVMSCQITDTRLYIKAVDRKVERELQAKGGHFGDGRHNIVRVVSPAITIGNSEVGMGALSVLTGVYDGFCSNLATFSERSTRKYHVGAKMELGEEVYAMLSDETRRKTDEALWAQIGDVVKAAFERAQFDSLCDKIDATASDKVTGDVVKVVSFAQKKFGLTEAEGAEVMRNFAGAGDLSRFGLYNAVTASAQGVEDYDRATELERLGGQIIELPREQWREIAEAA